MFNKLKNKWKIEIYKIFKAVVIIGFIRFVISTFRAFEDDAKKKGNDQPKKRVVISGLLAYFDTLVSD